MLAAQGRINDLVSSGPVVELANLKKPNPVPSSANIYKSISYMPIFILPTNLPTNKYSLGHFSST